MWSLETLVGGAAALLTAVSYFPQLKKSWETGQTGDLSLRMLLILVSGLSLWVLYGVLRGDAIIMIANSVSVAMLSCIIVFKLREPARADRHAADHRPVRSHDV